MNDPVRALIDRAEIADLLSGMTRLVNDQRIDAYLDCYAEDGIFELIGLPPFRGQEQIAPILCSTPGVIHMTTDLVVAIDGDTAKADSNLVSAWAHPDRAANGFLYSGRYRDDLVRTGRGWKMAHRRVSLDLDPGRVFDIVRKNAGVIDRNAWITAAKRRWDGGVSTAQVTNDMDFKEGT